MPFITKDRRWLIDELGLDAFSDIQVGDICYLYYKQMVDTWKANPRWTTVHIIYRDVCSIPLRDNSDYAVAKKLAWQVFFQLHVMPYELKKRKENGDIK